MSPYKYVNCLQCAIGYHRQCVPMLVGELKECCCPKGVELNPTAVTDRTRQLKDAAVMADPLSTGRKRAAVLYPIPEDGSLECEWALLSLAGGGVEPIIGCLGNPATDRHHGPDKDVINNAIGNVHRICAFCHNRWHALNDRYYGTRPKPGNPFIPLVPFVCKEHDAETLATDVQRMENEIKWSKAPAKKARD